MTQDKKARSGCGCSTLIGFFILATAVFFAFFWDGFIERFGSGTPAVIVDKYETIRIHYGEWHRRLQIVAEYSIPGPVKQHRAICDVDEKTYDSLHSGNKVPVHYFAALIQQPFVSSSHISPCTTAASAGLGSPVFPRFVITFSLLLAILFLWRILRIRLAGWLLPIWIVFAIGYFVLPRAEPEPQHAVPGTATVDRLLTIKTLGDRNGRKEIVLDQPYQIVVLKFTPPGMDSPVMAVDKIDDGSAPNLKKGDPANILYDSTHPRVVKLQQGTRRFPVQAQKTVMVLALACVGLIVGAAMLKEVVWDRITGRTQ